MSRAIRLHELRQGQRRSVAARSRRCPAALQRKRRARRRRPCTAARNTRRSRRSRARRRAPGCPQSFLRPPLVYGPGQRANLARLTRAVERGWPLPLGRIANRRSLIYVRNLADAVLLRARARIRSIGDVYARGHRRPRRRTSCVRFGRALGRPANLWPVPVAPLRFVARCCGRGAAFRKARGHVARRERHDPARSRLVAGDRVRRSARRDGWPSREPHANDARCARRRRVPRYRSRHRDRATLCARASNGRRPERSRLERARRAARRRRRDCRRS